MRNKDIARKRMFNVLEGEIMHIRDNGLLKGCEKEEQIDVMKGVMEFLLEYDINIELIKKEKERRERIAKYKKSKLNKKYRRAEEKRGAKEEVEEWKEW